MMSEENSKKIIDACPSLFKIAEDKRMWFGFECGNGWTDLLVELCEKINLHLKTLSEEARNDIVVLQIKEKFGSLRFYLSCEDDTISDLIRDAAKKSANTCEQCGKSGKIRGTNWLYCACDEHTRECDK